MKIVYFQLKANRRWLFSWTSSLTAQIEVEIMNENRFAVIHGSTEDYIDDLDSKNTNTATSTAGQMPMEFFAGVVIHEGQCTISVNTLNQSPTTSALTSHMRKKWKRIRI